MSIIINGKFFSQKVTGVQRYAREIVCALDKICKKNEIVLAIPHDAQDLPVFKNIKVVFVGKKSGIMWEQIYFPLYVKKNRGKSLNLCNVLPIFLKGIVCIHDIKIRVFPRSYNFLFRIWYRLILMHISTSADLILSVSNFSLLEIGKYYPKIGKIESCCIYNSWQHVSNIEKDNSILSRFNLKKNEYFFSIGSVDLCKNFKWIFEVSKRNPNARFIIAGSVNKKIFNSSSISFSENISFIGFITEAQKKALMSNAKAFLFPSLYEGFGIPPLEALACNCPCVVVSNIPVMREVYEDSVIYIDPYKYDYCLDKFVYPCGNKVLKKYSWVDSAARLYDKIKEIYGEDLNDHNFS